MTTSIQPSIRTHAAAFASPNFSQDLCVARLTRNVLKHEAQPENLISPSDQPKRDAATGLYSLGNKTYFAVPLRSSDRPDRGSEFALVDPVNRQFIHMAQGGLAGRAIMHGPERLPRMLAFSRGPFSMQDLQALAKAAAEGLRPTPPRIDHFAP